MPIRLKFSIKDKKNKITQKTIDELAETLLNIPELPIEHCQFAKDSNIFDDNVSRLSFTIVGFSFSDKESCQQLIYLVMNRLEEANSPFYLIDNPVSEHHSNDIVFRHCRFKPQLSNNQRLLDKLGVADTDIPDDYKCLISGMIMDRPIFDVRAPNTKYDEAFLNYYLPLESPKRMPDTKLPYSRDYIEDDLSLLSKISLFIEDKKKEMNFKKLKDTFVKFKIPIPQSDNIKDFDLGKALRRAVIFGTIADIDILLHFNVDINSQDTNPEKQYTALHLAVLKNKPHSMNKLLALGAKIKIPDAKGRTALSLVPTLPEISQKGFYDLARQVGTLPALPSLSNTFLRDLFFFASSLDEDESSRARSSLSP